MIIGPTVFVIGAGASVPYGFLSGPGMLRAARARRPHQLHEDTFGLYATEVASRFHAALNDAQSDSIDSLLEYRKDLDGIGRAYIAASILRAEAASLRTHPESGDWLAYLFKEMDTGGSVKAFSKNDVTFVTYNYDRRVEYAISRGLRARYQATDAELIDLWQQRPVIHLHGSVGPLLGLPGTVVPFGAIEPGSPVSIDVAIKQNLQVAADGVRIVHQADGSGADFTAARLVLRAAKRIVFLGFSFGVANVDRLGFENFSPDSQTICSRFQMTDAEAEVHIKEPFRRKLGRDPNTLGEISDDCLTILRKKINLIVSRY